MPIVPGQIAVDGALKVDDRTEDAASMHWPVTLEKRFSTALSQEAEVGVKWKIQRG